MSRKMRVAFVTPEIPPFSKAGRLADFSASLPPRLAARGVDISLVVPGYRTPEGGLMKTVPSPRVLLVPMNGEAVKTSVLTADSAGLPVYLLDQPRYFLRENIYGPAGAAYLDNDERFIFFSRAVTELLRGLERPPDVVHCHDWPTALVPVFLKTHYRETSGLGRLASVLTIHAPTEQGEFPPESLAWTGLNWDFFDHGRLGLNGRFNFLKAGIAYSDLVTASGTVLGRSLLTEKGGHGLAGVLRERGAAFVGLPNGTGPGSWDAVASDYIRLYEKAMDIKRGE